MDTGVNHFCFTMSVSKFFHFGVLAFLHGHLWKRALLPEAQGDCSDVLNLPAMVPSGPPCHPTAQRLPTVNL